MATSNTPLMDSLVKSWGVNTSKPLTTNIATSYAPVTTNNTGLSFKPATTQAKKNKLSTGAKVGIGAAALGLGLFASGVFKKKKNPTIADAVKGTSNTPSNNPNDAQQVLPQVVGTASQVGVIGAATPPPQKSNTMMYVGIGVGALVLIGVIVYASKK